MVDESGRFVIVFNGEIYNYRQLRRDLEQLGESFCTASDTEVLLKLYAHDGAAMLKRLRGMYAFAIWDRLKGIAFLARDPYGIKPLYIAKTNDGILFASQVKALKSTGLVSSDPDPVGQAGFWLLGSVPEPRTWFRDIQALPAGWYASISVDGQIRMREGTDLSPYWHCHEWDESDSQTQQIVDAALHRSVEAHLVADVPVAVFLSGGIDSGTLAGLMLECGSKDLQAITLAFQEFEGKAENEAPAAREIASHYGLRHTVRTVTRREFEEDLPLILHAMDQPTVDGINTWYASKAVSELGLKVVISGVGGDELFQGYSTFNSLPPAVRIWRRLSKVPGATAVFDLFCRAYAKQTLNPRWELLPHLMRSIEGAWFVRRGLFSPGELSVLMGEPIANEALKHFHPVALVQEMTGPLPRDPRLQISQIESMAYLRNQLLRDSDWASMAHSVELRTPLVDFQLLTELSPVLPAFKRFRHKRFLAHSTKRPLPPGLLSRPKTGFAIPVAKWLSDMGLTRTSDGMSRGWARVVAERVYALAA
jgi:asparagine synthase (glutamine-hydrolysing)